MKTPQTAEDLTQTNVRRIADLERNEEEHRSLGERIADGFAHTIGSWPFIILQSMVLAVWVLINIFGWIKAWDPYPFILLNLALSFQAAYASPIIMMSQNRQGKLNERRNHLDLQINLLAEQENTEMLILLRKICEKLEIPLPPNLATKAFEDKTEPENLIKQIDQAVIK